MRLLLLLYCIALLIIGSSHGFFIQRCVCSSETRLNAIRDIYPHYRRKRLAPPERLKERVRLKGDVKKIGKKGDIVSVTVQQWRTIIKKKHIGVRLTPQEMTELFAKQNATKEFQRNLSVDVHKNVSALPQLTMYGSVNDDNVFLFPFMNRHLIDEIHDKIGIRNIKRMILPSGVISIDNVRNDSDGVEVTTPVEFNFRHGLNITQPGLYRFGIRLQKDVEPAYVRVNLVPVPVLQTQGQSSIIV